MTDVLRNQIVERKVIELVREKATFKDEPLKDKEEPVEAIDLAAGGGDEESPMPEVQEDSGTQEAMGGSRPRGQRTGMPGKAGQQTHGGPTGVSKREAY